ncbi:hypothetical protein JCM6882_003730 [Rhodosporidiobolus microsporus]
MARWTKAEDDRLWRSVVTSGPNGWDYTHRLFGTTRALSAIQQRFNILASKTLDIPLPPAHAAVAASNDWPWSRKRSLMRLVAVSEKCFKEVRWAWVAQKMKEAEGDSDHYTEDGLRAVWECLDEAGWTAGWDAQGRCYVVDSAGVREDSAAPQEKEQDKGKEKEKEQTQTPANTQKRAPSVFGFETDHAADDFLRLEAARRGKKRASLNPPPREARSPSPLPNPSTLFSAPRSQPAASTPAAQAGPPVPSCSSTNPAAASSSSSTAAVNPSVSVEEPSSDSHTSSPATTSTSAASKEKQPNPASSFNDALKTLEHGDLRGRKFLDLARQQFKAIEEGTAERRAATSTFDALRAEKEAAKAKAKARAPVRGRDGELLVPTSTALPPRAALATTQPSASSVGSSSAAASAVPSAKRRRMLVQDDADPELLAQGPATAVAQREEASRREMAHKAAALRKAQAASSGRKGVNGSFAFKHSPIGAQTIAPAKAQATSGFPTKTSSAVVHPSVLEDAPRSHFNPYASRLLPPSPRKSSSSRLAPPSPRKNSGSRLAPPSPRKTSSRLLPPSPRKRSNDGPSAPAGASFTAPASSAPFAAHPSVLTPAPAPYAGSSRAPPPTGAHSWPPQPGYWPLPPMVPGPSTAAWPHGGHPPNTQAPGPSSFPHSQGHGHAHAHGGGVYAAHPHPPSHVPQLALQPAPFVPPPPPPRPIMITTAIQTTPLAPTSAASTIPTTSSSTAASSSSAGASTLTSTASLALRCQRLEKQRKVLQDAMDAAERQRETFREALGVVEELMREAEAEGEAE